MSVIVHFWGYISERPLLQTMFYDTIAFTVSMYSMLEPGPYWVEIECQ